jgi:hypothetical protein
MKISIVVDTNEDYIVKGKKYASLVQSKVKKTSVINIIRICNKICNKNYRFSLLLLNVLLLNPTVWFQSACS